MFKSLKVSILLVGLALLGLTALPAYPRTETASVSLHPAEAGSTPKLLGGGSSGGGAGPAKRTSPGEAGDEADGETIKLSIPKLGLEDIPVPAADSQVELDRKGVIHLAETGAPWEEGSNTFIVGHALGYLWTRTT